MPNTDEVIGKWAQENLLHGALAQDAQSSEQVWNALADLRKSGAKDVDKWFASNFMNAPPLSHNTLAFNQVYRAVTDLKGRLAADEPPTPPPAKPAPQQPAADAAPKE